MQKGDIVKLRSFPTKFMTVNSVDGNFVECKWVNDAGTWIFRNFKIDILEVVSEKEHMEVHR